MKKISAMLMAAVMAVDVCACGNESAPANGGLNVEPIESVEETTEVSADTALAVPVVKDGEKRSGEDCVEVYFEWGAVDGADGYEVSMQSKFYGDESFSDPQTVETTDTYYVAGAQDYFDFLIKVRAFKGDGETRVYSEWSEEAAGFSYDDDEISSEIATVTYNSYDEIINALSEGFKNGFTEDEQITLDVSSSFFANNSDTEIFGYMYKDLDGDGVDELLLGLNSVDGSGPNDGWDSIIYDVFTMKDGQVNHALCGFERSRFYFCSDGTIANVGSSGVEYSTWAYYKYADGKLDIIETVFSDVDENSQGHWYYSKREPYEDESNEITEDEAMKTVEKYTYQKLEFTPFN